MPKKPYNLSENRKGYRIPEFAQRKQRHKRNLYKTADEKHRNRHETVSHIPNQKRQRRGRRKTGIRH
jgi:hypothetical protein